MKGFISGFDAFLSTDMKGSSGTTSQEANAIVIPPNNQQMQQCNATWVVVSPDSVRKLGFLQARGSTEEQSFMDRV